MAYYKLRCDRCGAKSEAEIFDEQIIRNSVYKVDLIHSMPQLDTDQRMMWEYNLCVECDKKEQDEVPDSETDPPPFEVAEVFQADQ